MINPCKEVMALNMIETTKKKESVAIYFFEMPNFMQLQEHFNRAGKIRNLRGKSWIHLGTYENAEPQRPEDDRKNYSRTFAAFLPCDFA